MLLFGNNDCEIKCCCYTVSRSSTLLFDYRFLLRCIIWVSYSFLKQYNNACKSIKPKSVLVNFLSKSVLNPHEFLSFIMPFAIFLHSTSNSPKMRESRLKLKLSEIRNFGGRVLSIAIITAAIFYFNGNGRLGSEGNLYQGSKYYACPRSLLSCEPSFAHEWNS